MSLFLVAGSDDVPATVIAFFAAKAPQIILPIIERLHDPADLLRATADPGMLLHAHLDLIVDSSLAMTEEIRDKLTELELRVRTRPSMHSIKALHSISSDLVMLRQANLPVQAMMVALRVNDIERNHSVLTGFHVQFDATKEHGRLSHTTKIFLQDVNEHIDVVIASLLQFNTLASSLVDYQFNVSLRFDLMHMNQPA